MRRQRGFTLIEVMVSSALVIIVASLASALLISAGRVSRNSELQADAFAGARAAFSKMNRDIARAGFGASKGLYAIVGGVSSVINPVASYEGMVNGSDELWLVVPNSNGLEDVCAGTGGLPWVKVPTSASPLLVNCSGSIALGDTLLVSNYDTAAIVTVNAAPTATSISFAEAAGYGSMPNGFQLKDSVIPASLVHYAIEARTGGFDLVRTTGTLSATSTSTAGRLFDPAAPITREIIAKDVEDMQIRFYSGLLGSTATDTKVVAGTGQENLPLVYTVGANNVPRSVEVAVTVRSASRIGDSSSTNTRLTTDYAPKTVFNHAPTAPPDGYYRTVMSKRMAIPNMQPGSL